MVSLHSSNTAIDSGSFSFSLVGNAITTVETWTAPAGGVLQFNGLEQGEIYTLERMITNDSGEDWMVLEFELFPPERGESGEPFPEYRPPGFINSNNLDGLSFAQGSVPRNSDMFQLIFADEDADRDRLFFTDPISVNLGSTFGVVFGLRDFQTRFNDGFLVYGLSTALPEPGSMALLSMLLAGVAFIRRS